MSPKAPKGLVATIITGGSVKARTAQCLSDARAHAGDAINATYAYIPATLVEQGRDAACERALADGCEWLLQIDGDASFTPDAIEAALERWLPSPYDAVGAYAQMRSTTGQPTIDTGSGTWEEHYPGEGIIPVTRTGAHFFLIKTSALRRFGPPWFRSRQPLSPLRAMTDLDAYAHSLYGTNPLAHTDEWQALRAAAAADSTPALPVGEDSSFCDALLAAGGSIAVDCDLVVGHITEEVILPDRYIRHMRRTRQGQRAYLGILS